MVINTKFNIGDKVYFYISQENIYAWGEVEQIEYDTAQFNAVTYTIKNRFYESEYYSYSSYRIRPWTSERSLKFTESDVFASIDKLKDWLNQSHDKKMEEMVEKKKKGIFG